MRVGDLPVQLIEKIQTLDPAVSEKILAILEREQQHRHMIEEKVRMAELHDMRQGQLFAFIIVLFFGIVGAFLIYNKHDIAGSVFGGSAILGIVTTFIVGRKRAKKEKETTTSSKDKSLTDV